MRFKLNVSPWWAGLVLGVGAAVVQGFFDVIPPAAYGICFAGHPRDLLNWVANHALGTHWFVEAPSLAFPLLTVAGVLAGSWIAATQHGEFSPPSPPAGLKPFAYGFISINLALVVGACPTRSVLLAAYGDVYGIALVLCIGLGVVIASRLMSSRARRDFERRAVS